MYLSDRIIFKLNLHALGQKVFSLESRGYCLSESGVPPNNVLFGGTAPSNNMLFVGTVPSHSVLFGAIVLPNSFP